MLLNGRFELLSVFLARFSVQQTETLEAICLATAIYSSQHFRSAYCICTEVVLVNSIFASLIVITFADEDENQVMSAMYARMEARNAFLL